MFTANIWKGMTKGCLACFIMLSLCIMVPSAWAAHEVDKSQIVSDAEINTPIKWASNLPVRWVHPAMGADDILNGYFYKWNNSISSLNSADTLFTNYSVTEYGTVDPELNPPNVSKSPADLANLDSGNVLYLHIMT